MQIEYRKLDIAERMQKVLKEASPNAPIAAFVLTHQEAKELYRDQRVYSNTLHMTFVDFLQHVIEGQIKYRGVLIKLEDS